MCDHEQQPLPASQRVGYLSPIRLQEDMHKFRLSKEAIEKAEKDKTPAEAQKAITDMKKRYEAAYCLYIANAILRYQYRDFVLAPYNFR
jgi:hypothetical protein